MWGKWRIHHKLTGPIPYNGKGAFSCFIQFVTYNFFKKIIVAYCCLICLINKISFMISFKTECPVIMKSRLFLNLQCRQRWSWTSGPYVSISCVLGLSVLSTSGDQSQIFLSVLDNHYSPQKLFRILRTNWLFRLVQICSLLKAIRAQLYLVVLCNENSQTHWLVMYETWLFHLQ